MEELVKYKYLMFENDSNICWLDACVALIAHIETFKKLVKCCPDSEINKLISSYDKAMLAYNESDSEQNIMKSHRMLKVIQNDALSYLKKFLKFQKGKPDSAFCALLNFIYQDKSNVKEYLNVNWIWRKQCSSCGMNSQSTFLKPIITLCKVETFQPDCPSSTYICTCKSEQKMKLYYKELPPCLIFHFETGVKIDTDLPVAFTIKGREYLLTGVIILEKSTKHNLNHFVTWIRNPVCNIWLECNDLNTDFSSFSPVKPAFDLKDVYIAVFEAFDDLHRIKNDAVPTDLEEDLENSNVELINLTDEDNDAGKADSYDKTSNSELNALKERLLVDDEKEKSVVQNVKICSNEKSKEDESFNADYQDISVCSLKLTDKISLNSHGMDTISSISRNLEMNDNEISLESEKTVSKENVSVDSSSFSNIISPEKHENKRKLNEFDCQDESTADSFNTKKIKDAEVTHNQEQKLTDVSTEDTKEHSSLDSDSVILEKKSTYENPVNDTSFEETSDVKENEVEDSDCLEKESRTSGCKDVKSCKGVYTEKEYNPNKKKHRNSLKKEDKEELHCLVDDAGNSVYATMYKIFALNDKGPNGKC